MHCTVHRPLFRIVAIVCKGRDPIGAHITMFISGDMTYSALSERALFRTKGFRGASGEAAARCESLYAHMASDCGQNKAATGTCTIQTGHNSPPYRQFSMQPWNGPNTPFQRLFKYTLYRPPLTGHALGRSEATMTSTLQNAPRLRMSPVSLGDMRSCPLTRSRGYASPPSFDNGPRDFTPAYRKPSTSGFPQGTILFPCLQGYRAELRANNAILRAHCSNICLPICAAVAYRGIACFAACQLPLHERSLIYGSPDIGVPPALFEMAFPARHGLQTDQPPTVGGG